MFTLKIRWARYESEKDKSSVLVDETTLFIGADRVAVHGEITSLESMKMWNSNDYMNYAIVNEQTNEIFPSRIIEVTKDDKITWYLASQAWIMGPDGATTCCAIIGE